MNLTHLKVLDAVARHGSVTDAAKELNYSQPSVSHHLGRSRHRSQAHPAMEVGVGRDGGGEGLSEEGTPSVVAPPAQRVVWGQLRIASENAVRPPASSSCNPNAATGPSAPTTSSRYRL